MPMDGFTLSFMQKELQDILVGGRIDKVSQPERDTLLLLVRSQGGNHKLLLSANANQARAQLTAQSYENPAEPPMFCMLMRKHLVSGRICSVEQIGGDRILSISMECVGELGDRVQKTLYLEIMGRHSNLTLVDEHGTIVDSIKHVNREMSRVRTVLPGGVYELPPQQGKLGPEERSAHSLRTRMESLSLPLFKALTECVAGMASLCAKEVCAQLDLEPGMSADSLSWDAVAPQMEAFFATLAQRFAPVALYDDAGAAIDFFPFPYRTHHADSQKPQETLSRAMDTFYLGRDLRMRMQQRSAGLQKHIKNSLERLEKKKGILLETLSQSEQAEQNRIFGELLTANLHLIGKGAESVTVPNYYDEQQAEVTIPISNQLTPAKNAQSYYKKYRKAKVAEQYAAEQLEKTGGELLFLEGALDDLDKCETSVDLAEIRFLLTENGYLRPDPAQRKRKKIQEGKPYRFIAADGSEIFVGKNSLQNDRLTLHARGNETWLHVQGMPGSHVIIRGENEPENETLLKACKLAAYYSKGRNHPMLPIDYTKRKYVKKAAGAAAGFVTYSNFQTAIIGLTPEDMASIGKEAAAQR